MAVEQSESRPRSLHVRVVDYSRDGHPVVNIHVPLRVVKFGLGVARSFSPEMKDVNVDWDALRQMIEEGEPGPLVEVEDEAEHKTVKVWIE